VRVREELAAGELEHRCRVRLGKGVRPPGNLSAFWRAGHRDARHRVLLLHRHAMTSMWWLACSMSRPPSHVTVRARGRRTSASRLQERDLAEVAGVERLHGREVHGVVAPLRADLVEPALVLPGLSRGDGDRVDLLHRDIHRLLGEAVEAGLQDGHGDIGVIAALDDRDDAVELFGVHHLAEVGVADGLVFLRELPALLDPLGDQVADGGDPAVGAVVDEVREQFRPAPADADPAEIDLLVGGEAAGGSGEPRARADAPKQTS